MKEWKRSSTSHLYCITFIKWKRPSPLPPALDNIDRVEKIMLLPPVLDNIDRVEEIKSFHLYWITLIEWKTSSYFHL